MTLKRVSTLLFVMITLCIETLQECCASGCLDASKSLNMGDILEAIPVDTTTTFNTSQICGAVFQAKGNCCQYMKVQNYANDLILRAKGTLAQMETSINNSVPILKSLPILLQIFNSKNPAGTTPDPFFISAIKGAQNYDKIRVIIERLSLQVASIVARIQSANYTSAKCYSTLLASKVNAVCMVCAGDASSFYNSTSGKFTIKKNYCQALVTDCADTFDLYTKVNHALAVTRLIRNAMMNLNPTSSISEWFSLSRMQVYENCLYNLTACNYTSMLNTFCNEFGVLTDIGLIASAFSLNSDSSTLSSDANLNFNTSQILEYAKFNSYITSTLTPALNMFNSTFPTGLQMELSGILNILTTQIAVANTSYNLQNAFVQSLASNTTARGTRLFWMNNITLNRGINYVNLLDLTHKLTSNLLADMLVMNWTNYSSIRTFYYNIESLSQYALEAQNQLNNFKAQKIAFDAYEAALNLTPTAINQTMEHLYFSTLTNLTAIDNQVNTLLNAANASIVSYCTNKFAVLTAQNTSSNALMTAIHKRNSQLTFLLQMQTLSSQNTTLGYAISNATFNLSILNNYSTILTDAVNTGSNVSAVSILATLNTNYNTVKASLNTLLTSLNAAVTSSATAAAGTFYPTISTMATSANTTMLSINTTLNTLQSFLNSTDPALTSFTNMMTGIQTTSTSSLAKLTSYTSTLNANISSWTSLALQNQDAMTAQRSNLASLNSILANITSQISTLSSTDNQIADIQSQYNILSWESQATLAYLQAIQTACVSNPNTYPDCAAMTSLYVQNNITNTSVNVQNATALAGYNSLATAATTTLAGLETSATPLQATQVTKDAAENAIAVNMSTFVTNINQLNANISYETNMQNVYGTALNLLLSYQTSYLTATQNATTSVAIQQSIYFQQAVTFLGGYATLLNTIANNTTVPPANYTSILTQQQTQLNSILSSITSAATSAASLTTTVSTALTAESTRIAGLITSATTTLNTLQTQYTTLQANYTAASTSYAAATRRRLQSATALLPGDFTFDDTAGADINNGYASGIIINTNLSSNVGFTSPPNTTAGPVVVNNTGSNSNLVRICIGFILSIMASLFL